ncbi:MAG: DUF1428 domain-containing protein [Steroidobacteraceae bacterium]
MNYVQGFVTPVPTANKEKYRQQAADAVQLFKQFGVKRMVEGWGDDVPKGKVTDFQGAVQAKDDETVVFSWMEYPDKATYEAANKKMMDDPRMKEMFSNMPFDGKRMIFGGFDSIVDEAGRGAAGYADGYVLPVPKSNKQAYQEMAAKAADVFKEYGATRVVEAWGDDVPDGKVTDFRRAVKAKEGENVVFSFVEWPDKATRDAAWPKIMEDKRMQPSDKMPFDGQRMFWGGFQPILDA